MGADISIQAYLDQIQPIQKEAFEKLRMAILQHLPEGYVECMSYGMIGYVVPHTLFAPGYHCDPKLPLPYMSIAAQKNFIAVYHMGIYSDPAVMSWFTEAYPQHTTQKLDMGKSCIRFKKYDQIPFELIGELAASFTVEAWINCYQGQLDNRKK